MNIPQRAVLLLAALLALACASILISLHAGSVPVTWEQLWATVTGGGRGLTREVILELRLPRTGAAFVAGALLAVAGTLMQVLVRNPLADPYILGVSGGAATGALGAMLLGLGGNWAAAGAFGGALFSTALVFGLARRRGSWTPTRLLLTGVVVAAGWGAAVSFLLAVSPSQGLRGMLFWLMGDLSAAGNPGPAALVLAGGLASAMIIARQLNVLAHGELPAAALGIAVDRVRVTVYLLASLLTAIAVTLAGTIGFVGLVIPHLLRLLGLRDHRTLLPGAALLGGSLLTTADTLARTAFAPRQLPVGVLTAALGVPMFLYLLGRSRS